MLLLDEPSSGLDSTSAVALIQTLKALASEGCRTVCTSIHQPSSSVFRSFDRLLLLAEGRVVFSGTPSGILTYLENQGFPCPPGYNAADHCMDLLVVDDASGGVVDGVGGALLGDGGMAMSPTAAAAASAVAATSAAAGFASREEGKENGSRGEVDTIDSFVSTRARLIAAWNDEKAAVQIERLRAECHVLGASEVGCEDDDPSSSSSSTTTRLVPKKKLKESIYTEAAVKLFPTSPLFLLFCVCLFVPKLPGLLLDPVQGLDAPVFEELPIRAFHARQLRQVRCACRHCRALLVSDAAARRVRG